MCPRHKAHWRMVVLEVMPEEILLRNIGALCDMCGHGCYDRNLCYVGRDSSLLCPCCFADMQDTKDEFFCLSALLYSFGNLGVCV